MFILMETKRCCTCKEIKDRSKFGKCKYKNGFKYSGRCTQCMNKSRMSKPHIKVYLNLKSRLRRDFKLKNYTKTKNFNLIFGVTPALFKPYLESLFIDGMTWENYGEWEIDHIVPLSHSENQLQYEMYSNHKNVRPYWKTENKKKGKKITSDSRFVMVKMVIEKHFDVQGFEEIK